MRDGDSGCFLMLLLALFKAVFVSCWMILMKRRYPRKGVLTQIYTWQKRRAFGINGVNLSDQTKHYQHRGLLQRITAPAASAVIRCNSLELASSGQNRSKKGRKPLESSRFCVALIPKMPLARAPPCLLWHLGIVSYRQGRLRYRMSWQIVFR